MPKPRPGDKIVPRHMTHFQGGHKELTVARVDGNRVYTRERSDPLKLSGEGRFWKFKPRKVGQLGPLGIPENSYLEISRVACAFFGNYFHGADESRMQEMLQRHLIVKLEDER